MSKTERTKMSNYFPAHADLVEHYVMNGCGAHALVFTKEWMDAHLPKQRSHGGLDVTLLDQNDGKTYKTKIYAAYEDKPTTAYNDTYDREFEVYQLMGYFYGMHHCPCHRKQDAAAAGAVTDTECEGRRFDILKITPPDSDLILYSETMRAEELEDLLKVNGPNAFAAV